MKPEDKKLFDKEAKNINDIKQPVNLMTPKVEKKIEPEIKKDFKEVKEVREDELSEVFKNLGKIMKNDIEKDVEKNIVIKKLNELQDFIKLFLNKKPEIQKVEGKVNIEFPETQKVKGEITGSVKVENFPEAQKIDDAGIKTALNNVYWAVKKMVFPKPLDTVKVSNFPEQKDAIKVTELPDEQFEKVIKVLNKNNITLEDVASFFRKNPDFFINVRLTDGKAWYKALTEMMAGGGGSSSPKSTNVIISNIDMPTGGDEYSFTLPEKTEKILIKSRDITKPLQISFTESQSGLAYITIPAGSPGMHIDELYLYGKTIYFQSPNDSQTAEIMVWLA